MTDIYGRLVSLTELNVQKHEYTDDSVPRIVTGVMEEIDQIYALGMIEDRDMADFKGRLMMLLATEN